MADGQFNIAKGKVVGYHDRVANNDPAASTLVVVLLQVSEADATLEDYDDLNALLGSAGNTEADFTNYARIELTDASITASAPDDSNNWQQVDIGDQTWSAAGGTLDNTMTKVLICYDPDGQGTGNDTTVVPLCHYDFSPTTNGNDLVLQINTNGYFRAT